MAQTILTIFLIFAGSASLFSVLFQLYFMVKNKTRSGDKATDASDSIEDLDDWSLENPNDADNSSSFHCSSSSDCSISSD